MNVAQFQNSKDYAYQIHATAMEFYLAYKVIKEDKPQKHDFLAMKHYLLCHALELALKSLLIDTGEYNETSLKQSFGHDLEKLVIKVKQVYSSIPQVEACIWFIQVLNPDYRSKGYEYPINAGRFKGVEHDEFAIAVENLIHACAASIRSNTYIGKPLPEKKQK